MQTAKRSSEPTDSEIMDGATANFWSSTGPDILLVVNIQGIYILDDKNRNSILQHIDYEDILYVMGKGQTLKLGFVAPSDNEEL